MDLNKLKQNKTIKELLEFGIINIDKSSGPTSFSVSEFVQKELGLRKTSHFGTLDPKVTGVLPVALNRACKLTGYFLGEDKEYIGIMRIHENIALNELKKAIKEKFTGKIMQMPPVRSNVKRQNRQREIKKFKILEKDEQNILFQVECEGGTYIRKLISDLGDYLKIGAHMLELRRIRAGIFEEEEIVNLYDFKKAVEEYKKGNEILLKKIIIPGDIIFELHSPVEIQKHNLRQIFTGKPIHQDDLKSKSSKKQGEIISVFCENKFIGMYKVINKGDLFAQPEFVMQPIKL
ncbi:MAG: RNA-guided pseudouridylation complex pseudouridine synthase subunit Cbf5 [Nanoarchaeota archaeon]|nr:RNA-guided pseudouridylation complex pseudouridine synthase subunit Cbf5 [Nanoarchaeota archaeon]MBU4116471.1 RNA-guided pseudouridylation complex pseudouridine synthase subunit Cbf5 [Nanoarchaeota archaeon]